jgi:hypothetical protein
MSLAVYFGAGARYGGRVYTRDISIAGVLGVNRLYPRDAVVAQVDARNPRKVGLPGVGAAQSKQMDAPWEVIAETDKEVMAQ